MMWRPLIEPDPLDVAKDYDVDRMIRDAQDMSRCTPEAYRAIKRKIKRALRDNRPTCEDRAVHE